MTTHTDGTPPAFTGSYPPAAPPSAPASPPPDQPPSVSVAVRSAAASRRTTRRGVIVSVLVVLVGGVIAFAGSQMLTTHTEVLAVAQDVPVGTVISDDDLTTASVVKDANLSPIPVSARSGIVGMVAQVGLVKGELLTQAQVGTGSGFTAGQQLVALPVKQGQFPARGLSAGQKVLVVATPGQNGTLSSSGSTGSGPAGGDSPSTPGSGIEATIVDVGGMNAATQITVVDVKVASADGVRAARLASTGNVALILLPAGR